MKLRQYISLNKIIILTDQLNPYSTASVRSEALRTLLATAQLSEVVGCPAWSQIKAGLQAALLDITGDRGGQDEGMKLSSLALKVYVRLIGNTTENNGPFATREGFCGLTGFLVALYKGIYCYTFKKNITQSILKAHIFYTP